MPLGLGTKKNDRESGMVLSEDEVRDGEVLWRAFKCSHSTFTSFAPYRHPFSLIVGWPPTLTIEVFPKSPLRVHESLNLHDYDIYRDYALIHQELPSTYPVSHTWTASLRPVLLSYSYLIFIFVLDFRFHYAFCLWEDPLPLSSSASRKNFYVSRKG